MTTVDTIDRARARSLIAGDPILSLVHDYVERLRAGRAMAALADIDFFAIPKAVPHLFTMTVTGSPARFRYKFTGTQVDAIMAQNAMGRYLDEIYPNLGHKVVESYAAIARDPRPQLLQASFTTGKGISRTIFRYAIPLSDDAPRLTHILGVLVLRSADKTNELLPPPSRPETVKVDYV
ncbi:MAG: hypothetical protein SFV19_00805 [Rhodospirillaceae bacterium]|nr:hypothetical protein [Rhodospirillaceae bacterium]